MLDRFSHCLEGVQSTSDWKTSVGYSVDIIQEETSSANGDKCHLNPILLLSLHWRDTTTFHHQQNGEETTQVITGAVQLIYSLGQQLQLIKHFILQNSTTADIV
jgi:hypothetical protein